MSMSAEHCPRLLRERRDVVDEAIAAGCQGIIAAAGGTWSDYEVGRGLEDLLQLSRGRDCFYDRPSIGVSYALWYHGRRTQNALRVLGPWLLGDNSPARIEDFGCGTGAAACAAMLLAECRAWGASRSSDGPGILVEGFDLSPFMVTTAHAIEAALRERLDIASDAYEATFSVGQWNRSQPDDRCPRTLLYAGFVLDHSDNSHMEQLAAELDAAATLPGAKEMCLVAPPRKNLQELRHELEQRGWEGVESPVWAGPIWQGGMTEFDYARKRLYETHRVERRDLWQREPSWSDREPPSVLWMSRDGSASGRLFSVDASLALYDEAQEQAAEPDKRLTAIVQRRWIGEDPRPRGPAGADGRRCSCRRGSDRPRDCLQQACHLSSRGVDRGMPDGARGY